MSDGGDCCTTLYWAWWTRHKLPVDAAQATSGRGTSYQWTRHKLPVDAAQATSGR
ncbi:hypothetical protein PI125_g11952 [Phytophthora idaei]|nr:hypothetical protein PI125_g11952 [Phytophthora idaei]